MKLGWNCPLSILRGHRSEFPNYDIFLSLKIVLTKAKTVDQMKCHLMWHFIWVFTFCQIIRLWVSRIQRVNSLLIHTFICYYMYVGSGIFDCITLKPICIRFCCWWISSYARRQSVSLMHAESHLISVWYSSNAYWVPLETANQRTPWIFKRAIRLELP